MAVNSNPLTINFDWTVKDFSKLETDDYDNYGNSINDPRSPAIFQPRINPEPESENTIEFDLTYSSVKERWIHKDKQLKVNYRIWLIRSYNNSESDTVLTSKVLLLRQNDTLLSYTKDPPDYTPDFWGILNLKDYPDIVEKDNFTLSFEIVFPDIPIQKVATNELSYSKHAKDMKSLLENGKYSDFIIKTKDGQRFRVHKSILGLKSIVFERMFDTNCTETVQNEMEIIEYSSHSIKSMLEFIYTGELPIINENNYEQIYGLANKYELDMLKTACTERIMELVNVKNFFKLIKIGKLYDLTDLIKVCLNVASNNLVQLITSKEWSEFKKDEPQMVIDLLMGQCKFE